MVDGADAQLLRSAEQSTRVPIDIDSRGNFIVQVGTGYHTVSPDGEVLGSFPDARPIFIDRPIRP